MSKRGYYEVLGLQKNATEDDIKRAYKELAKKYHPDVNKAQDAAEKFKEVLEAYHTLSDPQKRSAYDQFGHAAEGFQGYGFNQGAGAGFQDFDFDDIFSSFGGDSIFGSAFGNMFGQGRRSRGPQRGSSIRYDVELTFEDAALGTEKEIEYSRMEKCPECNGIGSKKGSAKIKCPVCRGSGIESRTQRTPFGIFSTQTTCGKCKGAGEIIKDACNECRGKGAISKKRKIKLKVPAGINSGNNLRLQGEGNYGAAGYGDLIVVVFVSPHKIFKRDGADIFMETGINFSQAALGAEIEVPTIKGKAKLKISAGTQTGTIFKLHGQGARNLHSGGTGDEYVKIIVQTPVKLSEKERKLFEELAGKQKSRKGFLGL